MATRQELKNRSVKQLKEMLSQEGYDPAAIVGLEKEELVEKCYAASHFLAWHANLLGILVVVVVLTVRNMWVRQEKARKLRKRL